MARKNETGTITIARKERICLSARLIGTADVVHNNWSLKNVEDMRRKMELGDVELKKLGKQTKPPLDFDEAFKGSLHVAREGWVGFPAVSFKKAMMKMATQKVSPLTGVAVQFGIFIMFDGVDKVWGQPLVRIHDADGGEVERFDLPVKIGGFSKTPYVAARGRHRAGWYVDLRMRFDRDRFKPEDVLGLLVDAGEYCGIGAGRPGSEKSCGLGWGTFRLAGEAEITVV